MSQSFIDAKDQKKLDIFKHILFSDSGKTMKELLHHFELKDTTLRRYINELKIDLESTFKEDVKLDEITNRKIIVKNPSEMAINYIVSILKLDYIKNSFLYDIISSLTKKSYYSVDKLADDLNYSKSITYTNLSKLNELLVPFDVEIDFKNRNNFSGNEFGVRYFLFLSYWQMFDIIEMPRIFGLARQEYIDIDFIIKTMGLSENLTVTQKYQLMLLSCITSYRLRFSKKINTTPEFLEDIAFFYDGKICLNLNLNSTTLENESKMFSYMVRLFVFDIDTFERKKEIVEKFKNSELEISNAADFILFKMKTMFFYEYENKNYIDSYYLLIITIIYYKYIQIHVDNSLNDSLNNNLKLLKKKKSYYKVADKLKSLIHYLPNSDSLSVLGKDVFITILYIIYEMNFKPKPENVYVAHTANIFNSVYLKAMISKVFTEKVLTFCDSPDEAEIIISNNFESVNSGKKFFYFEDIYNKDTWDGLLIFLSEHLNENFF